MHIDSYFTCDIIIKRENNVSEYSNKGNEYFRMPEYNNVREFNTASEYERTASSESDARFDETTHRKNGYSCSLSSSRREKQKETNKIVAVATAGTVSIVTIVAVILAAIAGISFISFNSTPTSVVCIIDIPEDMDGSFTGVLYDGNGEEVIRTETQGFGELSFFFSNLSPDTEYFFSVFDAEEKQYLYESVKTLSADYAIVTLGDAQYFPWTVRVSLNVHNPENEQLTAVLIYDEDSLLEESFPLPEDGVVTAKHEGASVVRINVSDSEGNVLISAFYPLYGIELMLTEQISLNGQTASATLSVTNPSKCLLYAVVRDNASGQNVASILLSEGENNLVFENLPLSEQMELIVTDESGGSYSVAEFSSVYSR